MESDGRTVRQLFVEMIFDSTLIAHSVAMKVCDRNSPIDLHPMASGYRFYEMDMLIGSERPASGERLNVSGITFVDATLISKSDALRSGPKGWFAFALMLKNHCEGLVMTRHRIFYPLSDEDRILNGGALIHPTDATSRSSGRSR